MGKVRGSDGLWVWDPSPWLHSSATKQQGFWGRSQPAPWQSFLTLASGKRQSEGCPSCLDTASVVGQQMCSPQQPLSFSFPLQIDHTEVDTVENRQNGRPTTSLPAPKSAVSPCPKLHALVCSLPRFGKGEGSPCLSISLLTPLRQHLKSPSEGGRQVLGTVPLT